MHAREQWVLAYFTWNAACIVSLKPSEMQLGFILKTKVYPCFEVKD